MKKILLFILFFLLQSNLLGGEYPDFTKKELWLIKQANRRDYNRIADYMKKLKKLQKLKKNEQLTRLNLYLNGLLPQYDSVVNQKEDYWETPKEFLRRGYGDCEDYAIIKYYSLIRLHFPKEKLFLTIVKEKHSAGNHMVLTYFEQNKTDPLVLDNLSFKILPLSQRSDLKAELFINETGVYAFDGVKGLYKVANRYKPFEELQQRVANNR